MNNNDEKLRRFLSWHEGQRLYREGGAVDACQDEDARDGFMAALRADADAQTDSYLAARRHAVFQVGMSVLIAAFLVLWPLFANAAPRCPNGGQPDGKGRCVYIWRGATCYRVGGVVWCVTPAQVGEVQP